MGDIKNFFNAKTFAVIGASRDPNKVGHTVLKNLLEAKHKVFPINPNTKSILNQKSYKDIFEIPYEIDLVVIAVPSKLVPQTLKQAGQKKVKSAVILSAGFSETGNNILEKSILKIAKEEGIKIIGPNSYGFIDTTKNVNTTYFEGKIKAGHTAFISQSGAIGSVVLDSKIGLSGFVSVGNSIDSDFSDFIKYYSTDPNTKVITVYLESLKTARGAEFIKTCKACKKPILILKSGKSIKGQKAAASHTAALASEYGVYSGIFKQSKIIQVDSISQLFKLAKILEKFPALLKKKKGYNSASIITNAGGPGVLTTDAASENNIELPELSNKTIEDLNKFLPQEWSKNNPVDMIGTARASDYAKTISILEKEKTAFNLVLLTPQKMTESLSTAKLLLKNSKPTFACFMGGSQVKEAKEFMKRFGIINFNDPKTMCDTLGKLFK